MKRPALLAAAALACACGHRHPAPPCSPALAPAAQTPMGAAEGGLVLQDGRLLTPAGAQVAVGSFPLNALFLDATHAVTTDDGDGMNGHDQSLTVVDVAAQTARTAKRFPVCRGGTGISHALFYGLALSPDGRTLYAAGGGSDLVYLFSVANGALTPAGEWDLTTLPGLCAQPRGAACPRPACAFPAGLALSPGGETLYAALYEARAVVAIDTATGAEVARAGTQSTPHDAVLAGGKLFVSDWGASSVGGPSQVEVFDAGLARLAAIPVGRNPEDLAVSPDGARVFVSDAESDEVAVLDAASMAVAARFSVRGPWGGGAKPQGLATSPDGKRLYVALAGENAVLVLDAATGAKLGRIPAGVYPTAVRPSPGGGTLLVVNGRGEGAPRNDQLPARYIGTLIPGSVSIVPAPSDAELAADERTVAADDARPLSLWTPGCAQPRSPVPVHDGDPTPIEHVVVILRENKTYDMELGDQPGADGDPSLVEFGPLYTPNLHALASEFTNLDHCYAEAEVSFQGHQFMAGADYSSWLEKTWPANYRDAALDILPGAQPIGYPQGLFVWDALAKAKLGFRSYGELVGILPWADHLETGYASSTDIDTGDVARVQLVLSAIQAGTLEPFTFVALPRDHTYGLSSGREAPGSMVADNDEATGLLVEAISKSPFWKSTAIFLTEDDPQDGADHVDTHRTVCLVISPWAKRRYASHELASFAGLQRTYERILGLPPLSEHDAVAPPLYDAFTETPDFTPYEHLAREVPVTFNPGRPDPTEHFRVDGESGLGLQLWRVMRPGEEAPRVLVDRASVEPDGD